MVDTSSGKSIPRDDEALRSATSDASTDEAGARVIELADAGGRFRAPPLPRYYLERRQHLRPIVVALSRAYARDPLLRLSAVELFEAGWPRERCAVLAIRNRVHVAISTLRGIGLAGVIVFDGRGYGFASGLELRRAKRKRAVRTMSSNKGSL